MDETQALDAQTDDTTDEQAPASRPPTVPNVTPGAKSGLAHEVIGSAAQDAFDATAGDPDDDGGLEVDPDGEIPGSVETTGDEPRNLVSGNIVTESDGGITFGETGDLSASDSTDAGSATDTPDTSPAPQDAAEGTESGDASSGDEAASTS